MIHKYPNSPLLLASAALVGLIATPAHAALFAYEGFSNVSADGPLVGNPASGSGFVGNSWVATNGDGAASTVEAAGLSYPGTYAGTHTAVGGNGRATGDSGSANVGLDFDVFTQPAIDGADAIYVSLLAQRVGDTTTSAGLLDAGTRTTFNLASEYPRNFGLRFLNAGTGSNSSLGTIGKGSDWNSNGVTFGDPNPLVIDTWGAGGFNDINNLYTGADFADGVDHLVLSIVPATSTWRLQVNPLPDGSNDGEINFVHTDGGVVPFEWMAFGVGGGSNSSDRPVGDFVFDEIYIADSFEEAAGFFQVPEPSIALLGGLGLLGLARRRRA